MSLMDIAQGPNKYDLPVITGATGSQRASAAAAAAATAAAAPAMSYGRIVFAVQMVQKCALTVLIPRAVVTMRALTRHTSMASQQVSGSPFDRTPCPLFTSSPRPSFAEAPTRCTTHPMHHRPNAPPTRCTAHPMHHPPNAPPTQ